MGPTTRFASPTLQADSLRTSLRCPQRSPYPTFRIGLFVMHTVLAAADLLGNKCFLSPSARGALVQALGPTQPRNLRPR
eukprot:scaffold141112_cov31-Tisochrysis_lutea.AAC.4